jgi:hypothetical protein
MRVIKHPKLVTADEVAELFYMVSAADRVGFSAPARRRWQQDPAMALLGFDLHIGAFAKRARP